MKSLHQKIIEMAAELEIQKEFKEKYPNWIFKWRDGFHYAFRNVTVIMDRTKKESKENLFHIAIRVSVHGVYFFTMKKNPDLYWLTKGDFLSLEEMKGKKTIGIRPVKVGEAVYNGDIFFSDCVFEPGLKREDFLEIKQ